MEKNFWDNCPRYESCSAPQCPLFPGARGYIRYPEEDVCLYCRKQTILSANQTMTPGLLRLVPKENVSMLRTENRKLYRDLNK